jgi:ribonuclease HII
MTNVPTLQPKNLSTILAKQHFDNFDIIAGTDEAGRGCIAGPVVAAAVILPPQTDTSLLIDSKKLSEKQRLIAYDFIIHHAIAYSIIEVSPQTIDEINILNASLLAMKNAIEKLTIKPDLILIDGNRFYKNYPIENKTIVKGDSIYAEIAAASILAKVHRDKLMTEFDITNPNYGWKNNKGYPTPKHLKALNSYGITPIHRKSYAPVANYLSTQILFPNV